MSAQVSGSESAVDQDGSSMVDSYARLARIDPPVLRSLIGELVRISNESSAAAAQDPSTIAIARAGRDARRATAAQAALDSAEAGRV